MEAPNNHRAKYAFLRFLFKNVLKWGYQQLSLQESEFIFRIKLDLSFSLRDQKEHTF